MKKLLIVTDTFLPRMEGITRFLLNIMPHLKDFQITVLAPDFGTEKSTGNIVRLPCFSFQIADLKPPKFNFRKIRKYVKEADLVFVQSIGPLGASAILNSILLRKEVVSYIHVIEWELVTKAIQKKWFKFMLDSIIRLTARFLYNRCALLIVPSSGTSELLSNNRINAKKVVVHMGTDINRFRPPESKAIAKKSIGVPPNRIVIGYVGRLAREKNLVTLQRAFLRLHREYPKTVLLIVGDGLEEIKRLFRKKKGIIMTGCRGNVVPYLQAMDIYVLPSLTETSSLSTMEAMSCETAVVVTPVGYVKNYVVDKYNGMFFPKRESYQLCKKLETLLVEDKLRKRLGVNARKTIVENFSWDKTAEKIRKILTSF